MPHHKYIVHPCHWRLCQRRHGLPWELQWTAVPLIPDQLRGHQAHLSLWFSPRTARSRKMVHPSGPSSKLAQQKLLEGIKTERRDSITSVGGIQCKQKVNYTYIWVPNFSVISICSIRELSLPASAKQSKWWVYIILAKCWSMSEQNSIRSW